MDIVPAHANERDAAELRRLPLPLPLMLLRVGAVLALAAALWLLLR